MPHSPQPPLSHHYRQQRPSAPRPVAPPPRRQPPRSSSSGVMLAGGGMLALAAVIVTPNLGSPPSSATPCQEIVKSTAVLSRDQLTAVLKLADSAPKDDVRQVVNAPYCILAASQSPEGNNISQEAYPLAFDPQTWLVLRYDGSRYLGYDFRFRP